MSEDNNASVDGAKISGLNYFQDTVTPKLQTLAKGVARLGKNKSINKQVDTLNRGELLKQLDEIVQLSEDVANQAKELQEIVTPYRLAVNDADQESWTRAFVAECRALNRAVDGEYPLFRIFPIEVKVDLSGDAITINKRLVRTLHPKAVAVLVDREIARLFKEPFNPAQFMKALVRVYDALIAERHSEEVKKGNASRHVPGAILLRSLHSLLAARTGTGAAGYSLNQFAFDIYRLRTTVTLIFDGRQLEFGTTRTAKDAVVIPLPGGQKENLGSLELIPLGDDHNGQA